MQYVLVLSVFAKMKKETKICYHKHNHIYMCSTILILLQNDPNELFYSPTDGNQTFHPAKQTPPVKQLSLM